MSGLLIIAISIGAIGACVMLRSPAHGFVILYALLGVALLLGWAEVICFLVVPVLIVGVLCVAAREWIRATHERETVYCSACGYDLRATPDRCPECGSAVLR